MSKSKYASGPYHLATAEPLIWFGARDFEGTASNDTLLGTVRDDYFDMSQGGDDVIDARRGSDTIYYGAALTEADHVEAGQGHDTLILDGDYSAGLALSGSVVHSADLIQLMGGHSYTFTIKGVVTSRIDASALGVGEDLHIDATMSDYFIEVTAGAGDDVLIGMNTRVLGGDGDDVITSIPGYGVSMFGGAGSDTMSGQYAYFYFTELSDSTRKHPDLIVDYESTEEGHRIILSPIDADATKDGDQKFHLGATPGHVGDLVVHYNPSLDITILRAFVDGDAKPDMVIHLAGDIPLTAADFYL